MITIRNYTEDDLIFIKDNYLNKTIKEISIILNKKESSIENAVRKLGLCKQSHTKWTEDEIDFIKENYKKMTSEEMSKFINHSVDAINSKRTILHLNKNDFWSSEEIDYLKNNYTAMTHEEIAKILNRTKQAVTAKCFDLNLYKKELPWNQDEIEFVKNNYMEMPTRDIALVLNRSVDAVQLKARRMGMKKYPYTCNYNYFDSIDNEEKAYWLGFMTADGWISKNEKNNSGVVGIELQYKDLEHLKKFNKSINGNYKIADRWRTCRLYKNDSGKKNHECNIRIYSIVMYNSLVKLGFTNNKSFDAVVPYDLSDDLIRHYIRGYFDGNGCFSLTNISFKVGFITASQKLVETMTKKLDENGFNFNTIKYVSSYGTETYRFDIYSVKKQLEFLDWIYKDSTIYLDRKYKKYLKAKNKYENTESLAG